MDKRSSPSITVLSRRSLLRGSAFAAIGLAMASCSSPAPAPAQKAAPTQQTAPAAKALEKVSLRLDWLVNGGHTPYFLTLNKGWFRDAGLDVTIGEGKGSGSTVQLVATAGDTFGFADASVMIQSVVQGAEVMMVANLYQKGTSAIIVREDSSIKTLKDLEGKSFGTPATGPTTRLLPAVLKANGVDINKVTVVTVDNAAKTPGWLAGKYDAMSTVINDEPPVFEVNGIKVRVFAYGDYGLPTLAHGIFVHTKTLQEKPDVVRGFVGAALKGWRYAFEHLEETAKNAVQMLPESKLNEQHLVAQLKATMPLIHTEQSKGKPLGWMADKDWQNTVELLSQYGDLKEKPPLSKLFTNQFIPNE